MGYYTYFEFETELTEEQKNKLDKISNDIYSYSTKGECKWYSFEENMISFSKLYPSKTFIVRGDGEERCDIWVQAFKNGNSIKKTASLPDLEPHDLLKLEENERKNK